LKFADKISRSWRRNRIEKLGVWWEITRTNRRTDKPALYSRDA